jgi:hypothetical protein
MLVRTGRLLGLGVLAAMLMGGCTITVVPGGDGNTPPPTPTTITIRIYNNTTKPLDPQIYTGGDPNAGAAGLFVAANRRVGFGVGSLGIMEPRTSAAFTVECGQLRLCGTGGGAFGDDLLAPDGTGRQVMLEENVSVLCGDTLTFTFSAEGNKLITTYSVTPSPS